MKTLTISLIAIGACYTLFIKMPLQAATFDDVRTAQYSSQPSMMGESDPSNISDFDEQ